MTGRLADPGAASLWRCRSRFPSRVPRWWARWHVLVAGLLAAACLWAHGCHVGDHDDEPATMPLMESERSERTGNGPLQR